MAGYAAAMDASLSQEPKEEPASRAPITMATAGSATAAIRELNACAAQPQDPLEGLGEGPTGTEVAVPMGAGVEDWESQTGEDPDADKASLSLCMSETGSKKGKGEAERKKFTVYMHSY